MPALACTKHHHIQQVQQHRASVIQVYGSAQPATTPAAAGCMCNTDVHCEVVKAAGPDYCWSVLPSLPFVELSSSRAPYPHTKMYCQQHRLAGCHPFPG